jgi:hypothetical protein
MSIRDDCKDFMEAQLGHAISDKQAADIEARIRQHMKLLALKDPEGWQQLNYIERVRQAAASAAQEMAAEFKRKQFIVQKQIEAHDRIENVLGSTEPQKSGDQLRDVSRLLDFDTRRGDYTSVQSWANAIRAEAYGRLLPLWDALPGRFFKLFDDPVSVRALWDELHGEDSGNAQAKAGAAVWRKVTEELRQRFNDAGGAVGKLEDWSIPQHHSQERIAGAGIEKWMADILPKLDRDRYLNFDGSRMSDAQMHDFLGHAYDSIITDGHNSREPGSVAGIGMIANRNAAHRVLHFKSAESHWQYNQLYGERSLFGTLSDHISRIARDIALTERLGPNAERTFKYFNDRALQDELRASPERMPSLKASHTFNERLFDAVSGRTNVVDARIARIGQAFRNWMTATKLGKVVISALGDEASMASTSWANRVPYSDAFLRELKTLNPADRTHRRAAEAAGLGLDAMLSHMNRWGQEEYGASFTGKVASKVMQMSGAERMWAARRQGLGTVLMSSLGNLTRDIKHVADLNERDHGVLVRKGVTEKIWQVWRKAQTEDWGSGAHSVLTPKSVWSIPDEQLRELGDPRALKREASTQLLAHVLEEAGMGAMDTGPRQRVRVNLGTQAGTLGGELWRSVNLFRGFTFSMMMKHWARAASMDGVGRIKYLTPLFVYGTLIAALGNQIRNVLSGQDPEPMGDAGFWGKAVLRGGGLGFFGDFLYNEVTQHDISLTSALGGPALTTLQDILDLTHGAFFKSRRGERTDEAAKLIRFTRENIPFINLWYTQAVFDHLLWNHLQEAASPGYLERMESRQRALYGKEYYWRPTEPTPERAPDLARAFQSSEGPPQIPDSFSTVNIE